jgi:hypothetical protein
MKYLLPTKKLKNETEISVIFSAVFKYLFLKEFNHTLIIFSIKSPIYSEGNNINISC